ncbi:ywtG [Symbiodinium natans]|uniref:Hexose transporter 1 n=1 Tax=Symbiodinium natans TaxID=878477 RepID=A0A812KVQ2_9DINO|nr:ywtG [Symbiodinium natans]
MVVVRVTGLDGTVLFGPEDISGTAAEIRPRLLAKSTEDSAKICLLHQHKELHRDSLLELIASGAGDPPILELTAVRKPSALAQLAELARENAKKREEREAKRIRPSDKQQMQEQKERDIQEYKDAVEDLVQQLGEEALQKCRTRARQGHDDTEFDFQGKLQAYEFGAKMFFRGSRDLRSDPAMRGYYLSAAEPDTLECPDNIQVEGFSSPAGRKFLQEFRTGLVEHLRGMDLMAEPHKHSIHAIVISRKMGPPEGPLQMPSQNLANAVRRQNVRFWWVKWLAGAESVMMICIGRLISGCAIGLLSTVVALYQSEVAPAHLRGGLTSLYQFMITLGILVAAAVDVPLVQRDDGWRLAILLQAFPAVVLLVGMFFLPRSPRWLVQKGRINEAQDVLVKLRGEKEAQRELKDIVQSWQETGQDEVSWGELATGRTKQLLMVGIALQLLQQLVGMNALMYFGPRIFRTLGLQENTFQAVNNAVNCLSTLPSLYLADRCGRRCLLIWGAKGMICSCCIIGAVGSFASFEDRQGGKGTPAASYVTVAMVFAFVINFAYGWGPIVWVYCAEIFPLRSRSRCVGVTTMSNWIGNYLIAQLSPVLLESLGLGSFFVFAGFAAAALALACWLPETRGVALEDIESLFEERFGSAAASKAPAQTFGLQQPAEEISGLVGMEDTTTAATSPTTG